MTQSSLYKMGASIAEDVDVVDRGSRDLGDVTVTGLPEPVDTDLSDDSTRALGNVAVEGTVETTIHQALQSQGDDEVRFTNPSPLDIHLGDILFPDGQTDDLRVRNTDPLDVSAATVPVGFTEDVSVQDTTGSTVNPAEADAQGNWPSGYDDTVAPPDTTVTSLSAGAVPDGVAVAVQADPENADPVKVGLTTSPSIKLDPGAAFTANVQDRSQIHVQLTTDGDTVNVSHEAN